MVGSGGCIPRPLGGKGSNEGDGGGCKFRRGDGGGGAGGIGGIGDETGN